VKLTGDKIGAKKWLYIHRTVECSYLWCSFITAVLDFHHMKLLFFFCGKEGTVPSYLLSVPPSLVTGTANAKFSCSKLYISVSCCIFSQVLSVAV